MQRVLGRNVIVMYASEASLIDYSQIVETSFNDLFLSVDTGTSQLYFQYDGTTLPSFLETVSYYEGPYDYDTFQQVLLHSTWSGQDSALDDTSILLIDEADTNILE